MDFKQISEFIDLVKNPTKFEAALKKLQEEQARITAAVETIGKANELDKLRKQTEAKAQQLESDYAKKLAALEQKSAQAEAVTVSKQDQLNEATIKAQRVVTDAQARIEAAESVAQDFKRREKAIRQQEAFLTEESARVAEMAKDYEEKLAKLKSVMG